MKGTLSAPLTSVKMSSFTPATIPEMVKLIHKTTIKSCELDPLLARLLKTKIEHIAPAITDIVNTSLTSGKVTTNIKQAILWPLLKKSNLELVLKNYRPVSNLSFIFKMIKCVVHEQLGNHMSKMGNLEVLQSAYKAGHSTKTALLKVKTNILNAINNNEVVCLVLLDLSAVLFMISHQILLNRLKYHFRVDGTELNWLESYLTGRCEKVALEGEDGIKATTNNMTLTSGVPKGSILGPIIFTLYVNPIGDICRKHHITFHSHADDTQNYLGFKPQKDAATNCLSNLENCTGDIRSLMKSNLLKLNDDKSEFLVLGTRKNLETAGNFSLKIGNNIIQQSECIINLGMFWDKEIKGTTHFNKLTSSLYSAIRNIAWMRHLIERDTTKILMQALVLSKLDYCNSPFIRCTWYNLSKLQRVQNMAGRVILKLQKHDCITLHLSNCHWLKVAERIDFKVAVQVFKYLRDMAPTYLTGTHNHQAWSYWP